MKLALIGGGGVRAPLFVNSALRRAAAIHLDAIYLMDIQGERLQMMAAISRELASRMGSLVRIVTTENPEEALEGANYVVTSIRVGHDAGRVLDEQIALRHGVLGQETTGPGGFAMALRSIPATLEYARLLSKASPGAWMLNFTNPAGLVTQALRDEGFDRTIGICDGANTGQSTVARWLNVDPNRLRPEVFGLNHLSWVRRIELDGEDVLGPLLDDPAFLANTPMQVFEPSLVRQIGMWINEYLYYFYYAEQALDRVGSEPLTRGEEVQALNRRLFEQLDDIGVTVNPEKAFSFYYNYHLRRNSTYMHYARPGTPSQEEADRAALQVIDLAEVSTEGEGYAGVALDIMQGLEGDEPVYTALNVPNAGVIDGMAAGDVVEVSCRVDRTGVTALPIGPIPEHQELLMRAVKQYENLTVRAIRDRSRPAAVMALMAHPLVLSYSRASALVDEYLEAHRPYVAQWRPA
jgi:6-phospho-beta-glucosidase